MLFNKKYYYFFLLPVILFSCHANKQEKVSEKQLPADSLIASLTVKIKSEPKNADLYFKRALALIEKRNYKPAYEDLKNASQIDTTNYDYAFKLSEISFMVSKTRDTKESLERCLRIKPEDIDAKLKLAELYLYVREYKKSLALLLEVTAKEPTNYKAHFIRGIDFKEAGDTANAIKSFQRAVELNQNAYDAYMQLGILYGTQHDKIAIDYYNTALNLNPKSTEALYAKALFFQDHGDLKNALANYKMLLQTDSTYYLGYYNLGYITFTFEKDYRKATVLFTKALKFNPAYAEAYYMRGYSFENLGEYAKSIRDYTEAIKISPGYELAALGLERCKKK